MTKAEEQVKGEERIAQVGNKKSEVVKEVGKKVGKTARKKARDGEKSR